MVHSGNDRWQLSRHSSLRHHNEPSSPLYNLHPPAHPHPHHCRQQQQQQQQLVSSTVSLCSPGDNNTIGRKTSLKSWVYSFFVIVATYVILCW